MGKNDKGADGHLRVTFHHDWWAPSLDAAMPRVRFGQVHLFNNYFDAAKNRQAIEAAADAKVVVENNSFQGTAKPHSLQAPTAQLAARGNTYEAATGSRDARGDAFKPPYPFKADDAAAVAAMVKSEAGPPGPKSAAPATAPAAKGPAAPATAPAAKK
jgi:pectate lyase